MAVVERKIGAVQVKSNRVYIYIYIRAEEASSNAAFQHLASAFRFYCAVGSATTLRLGPGEVPT